MAGVHGTGQCPTDGTNITVRYGSWRCATCGTRGTTVPDGKGGHRLAVTSSPHGLAGAQGRYRQQLLDTAPVNTTL